MARARVAVIFLCVFGLLGVFAAPAMAVTENQKESPGDADDLFGHSVALEENWAVVGSPDDETANGADNGAAYIYQLSNGTWVLRQTISGTPGADAENFGFSVAIEGDYILVGAPDKDGDDPGRAYVFKRSGSMWVQQGPPLTAGAGFEEDDDRFGAAVALESSYALIGAPLDNNANGDDAGAAYVFKRSGSSWTKQANLMAVPTGDGAAEDHFGTSVALEGDYALVGSPEHEHSGTPEDSGAAYVFLRKKTAWNLQQELRAANPQEGAGFGFAVALEDSTALIGAPFEDDPNPGPAGDDNEGAAYIFTRNKVTWTQQARLTASPPTENEEFGRAVALEDEVALIGAPYERTDSLLLPNPSGSAYVFFGSGASWTEVAQLFPSDPQNEDQFGSSVSVEDERALVGAPYHDDAGDDSGAAYFYGN